MRRGAVQDVRNELAIGGERLTSVAVLGILTEVGSTRTAGMRTGAQDAS